MGNGFARFSSKRDISLLLLGIDKAGKTTILKNLAGEKTEGPTVDESSSRRFTKGHYNVLLMDVEGGANSRGRWPNYFAESHAIIYVIDASDHDAKRIKESKNELQKVLKDKRMACKPLLILCNKADKNGSMGVVDVAMELELKNLLSQSHSVSEGSIQPKTRLWLCSALKSKTGNRSDKRLGRSLKWLLQSITDHWAILSPRVKAQMEQEALNVNADPNIQHPPSGTPIHSVSEYSQANVNSEPVSQQNNVMRDIAEIESLNLRPDPNLDEVYNSNPGVTLLGPTNYSSFSTNTLLTPLPVSLSNNSPVTAGSPFGAGKPVVPPISETSSTEKKPGGGVGKNVDMLSDNDRGNLSPLAIATTGRDSSKGNSPSTLTDDSTPSVPPVKTSPTVYSSLPSITSDAPQISDGTNMGTSPSPLLASSRGATPLASSSITSLPVSDGNRNHPSASNRDHPSASDPNEIKAKKPDKHAAKKKNKIHPINDSSEQTTAATITNSSTPTAWDQKEDGGVASVPSEVLRVVSINSEDTDGRGHSNIASMTNEVPQVASIYSEHT